ncbi:EscU/YscU/HrcU family type III secretion system export apparatus switch protein [Parahaliea mediterranea]|uniref:EscU/YscU/HrcU family type III secretion system export apparatus switch protein n=1 Tax=Parahaliea mediterranea TaxID=651086 RepID=UPI000E2ED5F5|nr:EscU/YscU/HrcU family type III secretion system export apparatus switch protein [Parahaliea mediterranea]
MTDQPDSPRRPASRAAAVSYGDGKAPPRLLASGYGELAERIISEARRQGLFVHSEPALVQLLMQLDLDQRIPEPLYRAIAEVLGWLADENDA